MGKNDTKPVVAGKDKTVAMRFPKDMYYNDLNVPLYKGGEVVQVPEKMVERWTKRGGVLVADEQRGAAPTAPHVEPPKKTLEKNGEDEGEKEKSEK